MTRSPKLPLLAATAAALFFVRSTCSAELILLVGDSTVAEQNTNGPARGWGQVLPELFDGRIDFKNAASNGRSSKSFIEEGKWEAALASQPNYIFILWGTNDANADPARHTDPKGDFRDFLKKYIDDCAAQKAQPVLVTPSAQRMFTPQNTINNKLAPYVEAIKEVAAEKNIPVIDLNAASIALYEQLGPEKTAALAAKENDISHFNEEGARAMAGIIAAAIPQAVPALTPYLAKPETPK